MSKSWGLTACKFGLDEDDDSVGGVKRSCRFPFLEPDFEVKISLVHRFELLLGSVLTAVFGGTGLPASSAVGWTFFSGILGLVGVGFVLKLEMNELRVMIFDF
jgi:hypothetical protein